MSATTTAATVTATAVAAMLETAARNLAAYAEALRATTALPADGPDTLSRRHGAVSGVYSGLTDHVYPLLGDAEQWALARREQFAADLTAATAPAPQSTPPATTPPAPPAVPTLAEYETAMRAAFPTIPAGVGFEASYAGFRASGLPVGSWVGLTKDERGAWVSKATVPAPSADQVPTAPVTQESAPPVTAAKPGPDAPESPNAGKDKPAGRKAGKGAALSGYRKLQLRCKRAGLSAKGSKSELTARLEKHTANKPAAPKPAPAAARETTAPKATAPAGLANGTHKALARKLGVNVADLVDALAGLGLALTPVSK